jgi:hypothetical protein
MQHTLVRDFEDLREKFYFAHNEVSITRVE